MDAFIEEKNGSKYLVFNSTDENKEILAKYKELLDWIKDEFWAISGGKTVNIVKDWWKLNLAKLMICH